MLRPVDLQVLVSRTLEVQKQLGIATKLTEDEGENFRRRLQSQVENEQRQVRRKKSDLSKRIGKRPQSEEERGREYDQNRKEKKLEKTLGQNVDLEI